MTRRRPMTPARRLRIAEAHDWICHLCGGKIDPVREIWHIEHPLAADLGGSNNDEDLRPAHERCHKPKTAEDKNIMAKADRQSARHFGARKRLSRPLPGTRASGIRKRMNGTVERW